MVDYSRYMTNPADYAQRGFNNLMKVMAFREDRRRNWVWDAPRMLKFRSCSVRCMF